MKLKTMALAGALGAAATLTQAETVSLTGVYSTNPGEAGYEAYLDILERFHDEHPGVELAIQEISHDNFHTRLQTLAVSGDLPDILYLWPGQRTAYITDRDQALDLRDLIERDGLADEFLPAVLEPQGSDGEVYTLGHNLTLTSVVYANDTILDELGLSYPETLEEWKAQVSILEDNGYFPLVMGNRSEWVMQSSLFSAILGRMAGQDWLTQAFAGEVDFDAPEFISALEVMVDMREAGILDGSFNSLDRARAAEMFMSGRAAYFIEGSWAVNTLMEGLEDHEKDQFSMHVLPAFENQVEHNTTSAVTGTGFGINASLADDEARREAAWAWARFYAGPATAEDKIESGTLPALQNLQLPDDSDVLLQGLVDLMEGVGVTYVFDDQADPQIASWMNSRLQELLAGDATPEGIASSLSSRIADL